MTYENLIYQKEGAIARIIINRPGVLNALSPALLVEMKDALQAAGRDGEVGVVVLTGAGRAFSSGVDLASVGDRKVEGGHVGNVLDGPARALIDAMQALPKVIIAMVNGYCLTGALEIALNCDIVIASEEAKFGDTHTRWGIRPSWGMSQRLPRLIGLLKAKELAFTADIITAREAEKIGLVNIVVPAAELESTVAATAKKVLDNSRQTIAAYKYLFNQGMLDTLQKGLDMEANSDFLITDTAERVGKFRKKA